MRSRGVFLRVFPLLLLLITCSSGGFCRLFTHKKRIHCFVAFFVAFPSAVLLESVTKKLMGKSVLLLFCYPADKLTDQQTDVGEGCKHLADLLPSNAELSVNV